MKKSNRQNIKTRKINSGRKVQRTKTIGYKEKWSREAKKSRKNKRRAKNSKLWSSKQFIDWKKILKRIQTKKAKNLSTEKKLEL